MSLGQYLYYTVSVSLVYNKNIKDNNAEFYLNVFNVFKGKGLMGLSVRISLMGAVLMFLLDQCVTLKYLLYYLIITYPTILQYARCAATTDLKLVYFL